ncbi:MAG TPA: lysophospholipid acyltransferase family protein [Gemmatimonadaceae bacterium]|jgi:KDO2-lipid IV(A) lauroyltransferase|nr:lysophospholipid acyltransferase family protein [Gemmatimonadaceae bacterium]
MVEAMSDTALAQPIGPTIAHRAEYAALRGAVAAMERLSFMRAGRVGERIGRFGYAPLGIRRDVVERQLRAAFPEKGPEEIEWIARACYGHLGRTSIETAVLPSYSRDQIIDLFEQVDGWSIVEERLARGRGLILVSGHLGNWELGGAYIAARGLPLDAVARHMANPLFDRYLTKTRQRIGMTVVHDDAAVRRVPRSLRSGRAVAFLVDQGAVGLASSWVPFFGRYAKTPRGPAVFALRLGTPVVFGVALRAPSGRYHLTFEPIEVADTGDREADVDRIVADYTAMLERWVRSAPEQYLWQHRRWKHQRPGTPRELGDPL